MGKGEEQVQRGMSLLWRARLGLVTLGSTGGALAQAFGRQRDRAFLWAPVCFGTGIGLYFAQTSEPARAVFLALGASILILLGLAFKGPRTYAPLAALLAICFLGFLTASWRANFVAGPVLGWRYYGPVEGRVVVIDRSQSGALRLTLDQVALDRVAPDKTPLRVRISLHGDAREQMIEIGQTIANTAHLAAPGGPVEPHGFDFRRYAWFQKIGAFGYTRTRVMVMQEPDNQSFALRIAALRQTISAAVLGELSGREGAFAVAVTTGDRSAMDAQTIKDLRRSNLAHLLAISGLHMGLLTGVVFAAVRWGFALIPRLAMRVPAKKVAAVFALVAGAFYLALSGGSVATERAFVMVSVMLCAVLVNRRALSLRAVALAAMIVLALRPEALIGPGFQMSFAATAALVWVYRWYKDASLPFPKWADPVVTVVLTSAVAGAATAPFAAIHFNQIVHFGLFANVIAVPVMGMVVIPGAVLAAVLQPVGLGWIGLWVMEIGAAWILWVASVFGQLDGAVSGVPMPDWTVLPLIGLGGIFVLLWRGYGRALGVAAVLVAAGLWVRVDRPDVLIAQSGGLIGVETGQGRVLSRAKGERFTAANWLENDGDLEVTQQTAAARSPPDTEVEVFQQIAGKRQLNRLNDCPFDTIYIVNVKVESAGNCIVWTQTDLSKTGAIALRFGDDMWSITSTSDVIGNRLWAPKSADSKAIVAKMRSDLDALAASATGDQYVRINPTKRP